jgi:hypothetical protein
MAKNLPNTACTGQVGVCAIYKHFSHFEFILLPGRVHARPPASNASRWATRLAKQSIFEFIVKFQRTYHA